MAARGNIKIETERCKGCGLCIDVCPFQLLEQDSEINSKSYLPARKKPDWDEREKGCSACTMCALVCPEVAIEVCRVS